MKSLPYLIPILTIAILIRLLFFLYNPLPIFTPDSGTYLTHAVFIYHDHKFVSAERTPIYPLFMGAVLSIFDGDTKNWHRSIFDRFLIKDLKPYIAMTIIQSVIGVATAILIFFLAVKTLKSHLLAMIATIISQLSINVYGWDKAILTESFSIGMLILIIHLSFSQFRRISIARLAFLSILSTMAILLRPAFLFVPAIIFALLFRCWFKKKRNCILIVLAALVTYLAIGSYAFQNGQINGVYGVSTMSHINLFGKILQYDLPLSLSRNPQEERLVTALTSFKKDYPNETDPWQFVGKNNQLYFDDYYLLSFNKYAQSVLLHNIPSWIIHSFLLIPTVLTQPQTFIKLQSSSFTGFILFNLQKITDTLQYFSLIVVVLVPVILVKTIKKPTPEAMYATLLCLVVLTYVLTTAFIIHGEYGRFRSSIEPVLWIVIIYATLCRSLFSF